MCYRDMTFCGATDCARFNTCPRALTEAVEDKADAFGLPICQFSDPKDLECYATAAQQAKVAELEKRLNERTATITNPLPIDWPPPPMLYHPQKFNHGASD